ncbi:hypothetical protein M3Y96_00144800 [Aphelenchoides besseyi]|nr:hypothetical protein M3Y96_00144800 [Aphelenchoides besseyi]
MPPIYRQYQRIVSKWPQDRHKSFERNFKHFLERDVKRLCGQEDLDKSQEETERTRNVVVSNHNANLKALQDLIDNQHMKTWPTNYTSGAFGLNLKQLREVNSDDFRKKIGLDGRWSWFKNWFKS